jgi:hypothetical protein
MGGRGACYTLKMELCFFKNKKGTSLSIFKINLFPFSSTAKKQMTIH